MGRLQELRRKFGVPEPKEPTLEQLASITKTEEVKPVIPAPLKKEPSKLFSALLDLDLSHIDPLEFEKLMKVAFEAFGFTTALTPKTGDHGIDIKLQSPTGSLCVVQCKRYNPDQGVSAKEVREFLGAMTFAKATLGFFITTSYFTEQCKEFSSNQPIYLIDQKGLRKFLICAEMVELNLDHYKEKLKSPESVVKDIFYDT